MQEQMWVCDYTQCDFLECKFTVVYEELFWTLPSPYKGIIVMCINTDSCEINYLYSTIGLPDEELELWICSVENSTDHLVYLGKTFWRLDKYNCQSVERDPEWMTENYPILEKFWEEIVYHRQNGYESLLKPTSRSQSPTYTSTADLGTCLL